MWFWMEIGRLVGFRRSGNSIGFGAKLEAIVRRVDWNSNVLRDEFGRTGSVFLTRPSPNPKFRSLPLEDRDQSFFVGISVQSVFFAHP